MTDQPWLKPSLRTKIAVALSNFLIDNLAEDWYSTWLEASVKRGKAILLQEAVDSILAEAGPGACIKPLFQVPTDGSFDIYSYPDERRDEEEWLQFTDLHYLAGASRQGVGTHVIVRLHVGGTEAS